MPGTISVSFEREPDYFVGARVEGPFQQTIIARDSSSSEIVGMASRSVRDVFLNGSVQSVGYLSQVRIAPGYRAMRRALMRAFDFVRSLHQDGRARFHYTSMVADNSPARRLFSAGLPGMPSVQEFARMHTIAIHSRRRRAKLPLPEGLRLERGDSVEVRQIVDCLQRYGARYQLAPCWSEELLFSPEHTPDLSPRDFFVVVDGERVVGCMAAWDQSRFKQTVVRRYSGPLERWRGLANVGARLAGRPVLPSPNTPFRYCYASHALLRAVYNHAVGNNHSYLMIGLCAGHPFAEAVRASYAHVDYASVLYLVAWEDEAEVFREVDERLPGVEIATL